MIVVDANVLAYAVLPGDQTEEVLRVYEKDPEWVAPSLWRSEVRNVLATTMRVRGLPLEDAFAAFRQADRLVLDAVGAGDTAGILRLAAQARASAYDCEYVSLAESLGVVLVTSDTRLAKRFPGIAVRASDFSA